MLQSRSTDGGPSSLTESVSDPPWDSLRFSPKNVGFEEASCLHQHLMEGEPWHSRRGLQPTREHCQELWFRRSSRAPYTPVITLNNQD